MTTHELARMLLKEQDVLVILPHPSDSFYDYNQTMEADYITASFAPGKVLIR